MLLVSGRRGPEARGRSSGGVCWETVPFQNMAGPRCPLCHFSPLPEKSLKLNGSRGGIFSKCQCNLWYITAKAIILVPGSECQRTGRERAANSRLAGGTSVPPLLGNCPAWGGNWAASGVSGLGLWASVRDTPWAEGALCVLCALVFLCLYTFSLSLWAGEYVFRHSREGVQ